MKISYILQLKDFLILFGIGAVLGIFYGLLNIPNNIKERLFLRIINDLVFSILFFGTLFLLIEYINLGKIRIYLCIGYLLGFTIERITLGKLFAKEYKKLYTFSINVLKKFYSSKLGRIIFK